MTDNQALLAIVAALGIGYWFGKRRAAGCKCGGATTTTANTTEADTEADPMGWLTSWSR